MKLEAVNKLPQLKQKPRRVQDVSKYTDEELLEFIDEVKNIKSNIKYPYWTNEKVPGENSKSKSYRSRKYTTTEKPEKFAAKLKN